MLSQTYIGHVSLEIKSRNWINPCNLYYPIYTQNGQKRPDNFVNILLTKTFS